MIFSAMSEFRHNNIIMYSIKNEQIYINILYKYIYITYIYIYQTLLSKATYSAIQDIHIFVSTCVPWESNPQPLRC